MQWATADDTATAVCGPHDYRGDQRRTHGRDRGCNHRRRPSRVEVVGDLLDEGAAETFGVELSQRRQMRRSGWAPQGVGTITDDDGAPYQVFRSTGATVTEGDAGIDQLRCSTVTLSASERPSNVTVDWFTAVDTATAVCGRHDYRGDQRRWSFDRGCDHGSKTLTRRSRRRSDRRGRGRNVRG